MKAKIATLTILFNCLNSDLSYVVYAQFKYYLKFVVSFPHHCPIFESSQLKTFVRPIRCLEGAELKAFSVLQVTM